MSFTVKDWRNATTYAGGGDESTPLSAEALEDLETRVTDYADTVAGFNVQAYGAMGDGTTDDTAEIQAALDAAGSVGPGTAGERGATVYLPPGSYRVSSMLLIPPGVSVCGAGMFSTLLWPTNGFNDDAVLRNQTIDETQQYAAIEKLGIYGNKSNGALVGSAILLQYVYDGSYVRDVLVFEPSGNCITVQGDLGGGIFGPIMFDNLSVNKAGGYNILVEAPATVTWWRNITCNRAVSLTNFYFKQSSPLNSSGNHNVDGIYFESDDADAIGILIDNVNNVSVQNARGLGANAGDILVQITGDDDLDQYGATNISLQQLQTAANCICVDDQVRGMEIDGPLLTRYDTNDTTHLAPSFQNSWVNHGSGYKDAAYSKDGSGIVRLHGAIKNGTVGSVAFQLPVGYRPSASLMFGTVSAGAFGRFEIGPDGGVVPYSPSVNSSVGLEGASFPAEQ